MGGGNRGVVERRSWPVLIVALVALASLALPASAQESAGAASEEAGAADDPAAPELEVTPLLQQWTHELALHFSPDFEGAIGDIITLQAGYGVFVLDDLLVRGTCLYTLMEDVAPSDYRVLELDLGGEYHLSLGGRFVPYVGAQVGWRRLQWGDANRLDDSGAVFGARAGLKSYLADNAAIDFHLTYGYATDDLFINDFKPEHTDISSLLGLRFSF